MRKKPRKSSQPPLPWFKKFLPDIALIILLLLLTVYAWRMLPQTVIRSDGFIHMLAGEQARFWKQDYPLTGIEVGPTLVGAVLPKLFGPHVSLYLWFEVGVILLINVLFYLLVRSITSSRLIAFSAALIAGVSYFGNWNAYGAHCFCFFLERVINMPFMLMSFLLLHLYLTKNKKYNLILSLFLYFIGIGLGHVELILTPAFALYPFWWFAIGSWKKDVWKGIGIAALYFLISLGITWAQQLSYRGWGPKWTFTEFILHPEKYDYFRAMALQLVYWSDYRPTFAYLTSPEVFGRLSSPQQAIQMFPYIFLLYIGTATILFIGLKNFRSLILTCLFSVTAIFFLNAYVKLPEIIVPDSNRYLYFPTFFLSVFWAIALWYFFLKHKNLKLLAGVAVLGAYYFVNVSLLENIFGRTFGWDRSTKMLFTHVVQTRDTLVPNTLVVATYPEFWVQEADFFTETLGKGEVIYETDSTAYADWKTKIPSFRHVITIQYDKKCDCVQETKVK